MAVDRCTETKPHGPHRTQYGPFGVKDCPGVQPQPEEALPPAEALPADDLTERLAGVVADMLSRFRGEGPNSRHSGWVRDDTLAAWRSVYAEWADQVAPEGRDTEPADAAVGELAGFEIVATRLHRGERGELVSGDVVASAVSDRPTLAEALDELRSILGPTPHQHDALCRDIEADRDRLAEAIDMIGTAVMSGTDDTLRDGIRSMVRRVRPEAISIWETGRG